MSKARVAALRGLVESDDELDDILAGETVAITKMPTTRKGRTAAANKVTKPTQAATRGKAATTAKASTRKALADKPANVQEMAPKGKGRKRPATEEIPPTTEDNVDESSVAEDAKPKGGRGRPRAAKAAKISNEEDISNASQPEPAAAPVAKRGRKPKAKANTPPPGPEIPETQPADNEIPETQAVETTELSIEENEQVEDLPPYNQARSSSVQRLQTHSVLGSSRRTVPASDSELHDPLMRRRVGDLTRKYENLEAKYRDLREIGVKEAEHNYDRLKKQTEEKANTANQLIATLKAQLSAQTELAKEAQRLRQQLEASQAKADELQNKVDDTNASLTGAKTEIKTLTTKLSAARTTDTVNAKVPGSAIKGTNSNNRLLASAEAAAQAAAQVAQMKEDLYGDLTGLIIRGVKREQNGGETYDCIQTGRNGTLHFKLAMGGSELTEGFDEPQLIYMPQLDPSRDQDLIDILPDYLVEEITFPQTHGARFYSRVMRSLTERPE
ncbi:hypothetical protein M426DRAFT_321886 [Hypoxylon sp. CI-4A]|nr:hypothetical protein M426DRAFT_321886 [Hypoxylon sp. CI-4A]